MITQQIVDYNGIRVLTSLQIADAYETTTTRIKQNFNKNKVDLLSPIIYNDIQKVRWKVNSKMGRPKIENPKSKQISVRLDNETFEKLEECSKTLNLTRVEVLRKGVDKIFSDIKK